MNIVRKRLGPVKETQMVSLADIAFLIIFFFMLTSQFMADRTQVDLPTLPMVTKTDSAISVSMDLAAKIYLNGQEVADQDALESALRDLLANKTKAEEAEVMFKCDKNLKYKNYRPIYEAISNAGGVIAIMHEPAP